MADYTLLAQYPKQAVVRDRNLGGLVAWSAYTCAIPIPSTKPDADWVRARIVAEQIPLQTTIYVDRTISYFLQDPQTETNIRDYLSEWNSEAAEAALSDQVQTVIGTFMARFAAADVSDAQVEAWYVAHGFAVAPAQ
jgi:hypothetical protein